MSERSTGEWLSSFAAEVGAQSAIYADWASSASADAELIELIDTLPLQKRQPNLLFACSRFLGAPEGPYPQFRRWLVDNFDAVAAETAVRMTQTNEPGRCASLMPALGLLDGPLALLEVGASAGLTLYPDRFSYSYDGAHIDPSGGPGTVLLESVTNGRVPLPTSLPQVVWRAGIDLAPLDVFDAEHMRWLETLVWPEQHLRRARLRAAIEVARADPPVLVAGDATDALPALAAQAPPGATLVVVASGTLVYLTAAERARFVEVARATGAHLLTLEGRSAIPSVEARLPPGDGRFVLALDEQPLAFTGPHGQALDWF